MIVKKQNTNYLKRAKYVQGAGFMDVLGGIGSYIAQNKDLIAKPLLSAAGETGALLMNEGARAIIERLRKKDGKGIKNRLVMNESARATIERLKKKEGRGIKKF